jgi:hypothetical protein
MPRFGSWIVLRLLENWGKGKKSYLFDPLFEPSWSRLSLAQQGGPAHSFSVPFPPISFKMEADSISRNVEI